MLFVFALLVLIEFVVGGVLLLEVLEFREVSQN